ncbi:DUF2961 domain-containing protein [Candidatus Poribacteria bacterium]|nr:DUF2961 domain-containing protein [Candidatus Poribacteria bacterium]
MWLNLANIFQKHNAESRSISAENPKGEVGKGAMADPKGQGAARELGVGWKVRPCITLKAGETTTLMDNEGPGVIRHIWFTFSDKFYRDVIIRIYWDGDDQPSVQAPLGDLMCNSWNCRQNILALPINVNPSGGMNIYFPMPFRKHAKITVENDSPNDLGGFFYTINYTLEDVPEDALYFHALWRRSNPLAYGTEYLMADGIKGCGQYVGTFMAWQQNSAGWWGEGEIKMYLDGDKEFPTICGTGTEDYFGGAWCFGADFSAPYLGFLQVRGKSGDVGTRMVLYRFHIHDPVFFKSNLKVTMQALGWRAEGRYLPLQDDISSVVYWYQDLPHAPLPDMPDRNGREII